MTQGTETLTVAELIASLLETCNGNTEMRVVMKRAKVEGDLDGDNIGELFEEDFTKTIAGNIWRKKCDHDLIEAEELIVLNTNF